MGAALVIAMVMVMAIAMVMVMVVVMVMVMVMGRPVVSMFLCRACLRFVIRAATLP